MGAPAFGSWTDRDEHAFSFDTDRENVERSGSRAEYQSAFVSAVRGAVARTPERTLLDPVLHTHFEVGSERDRAADVGAAVPEGREAVRAADQVELARCVLRSQGRRFARDVTRTGHAEVPNVSDAERRGGAGVKVAANPARPEEGQDASDRAYDPDSEATQRDAPQHPPSLPPMRSCEREHAAGELACCGPLGPRSGQYRDWAEAVVVGVAPCGREEEALRAAAGGGVAQSGAPAYDAGGGVAGSAAVLIGTGWIAARTARVVVGVVPLAVLAGHAPRAAPRHVAREALGWGGSLHLRDVLR